ncbi:MAG: hypothetical protein GY862_06640 [Gammaproteobacteria bacterium]|nr:hypothetical protein [Gammaproteobacteria bacterium]
MPQKDGGSKKQKRKYGVCGISILVVLAAIAASGCVQGKGPPARSMEVISAADNDFVMEARLLCRIAACAGKAPLPEQISDEVVKHCAEFKRRMRKYAGNYVDSMKPFIAGHLPANLPLTVVYPFGGGDLVSALTTYPDAAEIYTLSLEHAGDIRHIGRMESRQAREGLYLLRNVTRGLIGLHKRPTVTVNTNASLRATQRGAVPGQIALFLVALAIHGQEPVSLRYFSLEQSGDIRYLSADDIAAMQGVRAMPLMEKWTTPDFSAAFSNCELRFKPRGKAGPVRVHRHIAVNLANSHFHSNTPVFRHLMKKGRVAAMTKGAMFLLWTDEFSNIRDYLIDQVDFMISDSTGLSPLHAIPAGFVYTAFGRFEGAFGSKESEAHHNLALHEVFQRQPYRWMPNRYGYPDKASNAHMVFMRRAGE